MATKHTVSKGDTVSDIAAKYGVRIQDIISANPNLKDVNKIRIDQKLNIPAAKKGDNMGSQGPYGRTSKTEMNMMRGDGESYTRGVRAKMKAGAETSPTPKKAAATKAAKSSATPGMTKAKAMMSLPKSKPDMKAKAAKLAAAKSASIKPATKAMNKQLDEMRSRFRSNKSYGGKMVKRAGGGGMGCGAAMKGFGAVRKS
jgi:murein DD-endopeptidase MepM/ murein hydrolase activator NlpD